MIPGIEPGQNVIFTSRNWSMSGVDAQVLKVFNNGRAYIQMGTAQRRNVAGELLTPKPKKSRAKKAIDAVVDAVTPKPSRRKKVASTAHG